MGIDVDISVFKEDFLPSTVTEDDDCFPLPCEENNQTVERDRSFSLPSKENNQLVELKGSFSLPSKKGSQMVEHKNSTNLQNLRNVLVSMGTTNGSSTLE